MRIAQAELWARAYMSWTDPDLSTVSRTAYSYRVRAYNEAGTSAYSNELSATAK
jgi:hypothetical protein